jgi:acetolactate synthase-1/2/3 large subunit
MRLSDYVIKYLKDNYGVDSIFTVSGGGCIFLIDSLTNIEGVQYIATHHEQAAAMAAEGYARMNGKLGACIVTSGPGGTNAITGVLGAWLDSIPMIVISGQVNKEMTTNYTQLPLRQLGDQEFNIIESVKNMTKYAVQINDPNEIKYHLDKACKLATSGRPGPVWLDMPLNTQSAEINPDNLEKLPFTVTVLR